MTLTWKPPKSDGGSKITGYIVEKKDPFTGRWVVISTSKSTELDVPNLVTGQSYQFRIAAENKAGAGTFSEPTKPTIAKEPYGTLYDICKSVREGKGEKARNLIRIILILGWERPILYIQMMHLPVAVLDTKSREICGSFR